MDSSLPLHTCRQLETSQSPTQGPGRVIPEAALRIACAGTAGTPFAWA